MSKKKISFTPRVVEYDPSEMPDDDDYGIDNLTPEQYEDYCQVQNKHWAATAAEEDAREAAEDARIKKEHYDAFGFIMAHMAHRAAVTTKLRNAHYAAKKAQQEAAQPKAELEQLLAQAAPTPEPVEPASAPVPAKGLLAIQQRVAALFNLNK